MNTMKRSENSSSRRRQTPYTSSTMKYSTDVVESSYFNSENNPNNINSTVNRPQESIQKTLQLAYKEKNLMLQQIEALRKQIQDSSAYQNNQIIQRHSSPIKFIKEDPDSWNKLVEANIRAGTLACLWCMKTHVIKHLSKAFCHWKIVAASLPSRKKGINIEDNNQRIERINQYLLNSESKQIFYQTLLEPKGIINSTDEVNNYSTSQELDSAAVHSDVDKKRLALLSYVSRLSEDASLIDKSIGETSQIDDDNQKVNLKDLSKRGDLFADKTKDQRSNSRISKKPIGHTPQVSVRIVSPTRDFKQSRNSSSLPSYLAPTFSSIRHITDERESTQQLRSMSIGRSRSNSRLQNKSSNLRNLSPNQTKKSSYDSNQLLNLESAHLNQNREGYSNYYDSANSPKSTLTMSGVSAYMNGKEAKEPELPLNIQFDPIVEGYIDQSKKISPKKKSSDEEWFQQVRNSSPRVQQARYLSPTSASLNKVARKQPSPWKWEEHVDTAPRTLSKPSPIKDEVERYIPYSPNSWNGSSRNGASFLRGDFINKSRNDEYYITDAPLLDMQPSEGAIDYDISQITTYVHEDAPQTTKNNKSTPKKQNNSNILHGQSIKPSEGRQRRRRPFSPPGGKSLLGRSEKGRNSSPTLRKMTKAQYLLIYGGAPPVEDSKAWTQSLRS